MTERIRLCRSFQTAPAAVPGDDTAKYLRSAVRRDGLETPDWLCPDLEDSVATEMLETARQNSIDVAVESPQSELWPRINWDHDAGSAAQDQGHSDLDALVREAGKSVDGFIIPKVGKQPTVEHVVSEISAVEEAYGFDSDTFEVCLILETPEAVSDLHRIGRYGGETARITGLLFGPGDFTFGVGGRMTDGQFPAWGSIREWLTTVASANDLYCIGGTHPNVYSVEAGKRYYDGDSYAGAVTNEATIGFDGAWSLHPAQTVQANTIHSPSETHLLTALRRLEQFLDAGETNALLIDGEVVDAAMVQHYRHTIRLAVAIWEQRDQQAQTLYDEAVLERAVSALA